MELEVEAVHQAERAELLLGQAAVEAALDPRPAGGSLDGLKVLVTAGGTREPIDSVRYVGNRSSGRMGYALAEEAARPKSSMEPSPSRLVEERLLGNRAPLTPAEAERLVQAIIGEPEPAYIHEITALLLRGKDPRRIVDAIQVASARVILMVQKPTDFSMPHHSYEYSNTLGWFYDTFEHPHRLKLLYVAGSFVNQAAHWVRNTPGNGAVTTRPPQGAAALNAAPAPAPGGPGDEFAGYSLNAIVEGK